MTQLDYGVVKLRTNGDASVVQIIFSQAQSDEAVEDFRKKLVAQGFPVNDPSHMPNSKAIVFNWNRQIVEDMTDLTVAELINVLRTFPQGARVKVTWEGVVRSLDADNVYMSDDGVMLIDGDENFYPLL